MTVINSFDRFIEKKRLKNCSSKTIQNYQEFVMPFVVFVGAFSDVMIIDTDIVHSYIKTLYARPLADASRATYITHIRAFLRWLKDLYSIPVALSEIDIPKVGKKNVVILDEPTAKRLFDSIVAENEWLTYRNCAIVCLMLDIGLRQGEIVSLMWKNINFEKRTMIVCGKGSKERLVPIGSSSIDFLQAYRFSCPYHLDNVFVERRGQALTCNAVKQMVQKLKKKTGIDFSSHKLRHNFATHFFIKSYEDTGQYDRQTLQILMGHEDIRTTEKYIHGAAEHIAATHNYSFVDNVFGV